MGELLLQIQKQSGNQYTNASSSNIEKAKTKTEITSEMGMSKDQLCSKKIAPHALESEPLEMMK